MCCPTCIQHSSCRTRTEIHAHKMAQSSMPNPHYHLCKPAATACDFNCKRCGRLIREMSRLSSAQHFAYGCCHRCTRYQGCDFVDKHRKVLEFIAAPRAVESVESEFVEAEPVTSAVMPPQEPAVPSPPA